MVIIATAIFLFGAALRGYADEFHYENFRFGQRALGMGGAVTAYLGEPEAGFYNPAGLAFVEGTRFSGAMNFYGFDEHKLLDSFVIPGPDQNDEDEVSNTLLALPSSSVIAKEIRGGDHVIALSMFQVVHSRENFSNNATLPAPQDVKSKGIESVSMGSSLIREDRVMFVGGNYAWRIRRDLAVGITGVYARRDQNTSVRKNSTTNYAEGFNSFFDISTGSDISDGAGFVRLGIQYRKPSDRWRLGLGCSSSSVRIHGEGRLVSKLILSGNPLNTEYKPALRTTELDVVATTEYPLTFRLGGLLRPWDGWVLTLDLAGYGALAYQRLALDDVLSRDDIVAQNVVRSQFANDVVRESVFNVAVGSEIVLRQRWPLRLGFFTNRTSSPPIAKEPRTIGPPHVHIYGVTASVGYLGDQRSINFGGEFQWG